ncbi:hypothetical protein [Sphingomonas echinoides]|uniref:hypothetical protein n=1 Tax=Sphingomonas echinoides TaxID=59803 RepID=UPI0024131107|nr:hypothetical protein [Sphingomonas echinoides]
MRLTKFWQMAAVASVAAFGSASVAQQGFVQNQAHFRAALDHTSTSPSFILITVVNGSSGARRTGCTMAGFLLHAIATEEGIDRTEYHGAMLPDVATRVKDEALASKDHVYTFHKAEALAAVPTDDRNFNRACKIIYGGLPAYMQDRSGQISPGWPLGTEPKP